MESGAKIYFTLGHTLALVPLGTAGLRGLGAAGLRDCGTAGLRHGGTAPRRHCATGGPADTSRHCRSALVDTDQLNPIEPVLIISQLMAPLNRMISK